MSKKKQKIGLLIYNPFRFITDVTSFAGFFNYPTMRNLLDNFCVYHVNAPGQEEGAASFPEEYEISPFILLFHLI